MKNGLNTLKDQVGGTHYRSQSIQPIQYIQANDLGYEEGNIVKYITRHKFKGSGEEDLKKAIQYIAFILENEYGVVATTEYTGSSEQPANVESVPVRVPVGPSYMYGAIDQDSGDVGRPGDSRLAPSTAASYQVPGGSNGFFD